MNAGLHSHIPEDVLERYALRQVPGAECSSLHAHLLHCSACQINLNEIIEYVAVMKAATARVKTADRTVSSSFKVPPERHAASYTRGNIDGPGKGTG
jgi:hypothetical protein